MRAKTLEPRLTPARAAAYAIAACVHLVTLLFLAAGAFLIVATLPSPWGILLGLLIASPALLFMPRLGKLPKEGKRLARSDAPTLFEIVDEVADALGTKKASVLIVDADYNASWSVVGWRRHRVLTLGLPFLTSLEPQERVALIAHEFAHAKNGDSTRGFFVGGALGALIQLYWIVRPQHRSVGPDFLINWIFILISRPLWWLILLEFHLLRRDSQRADLADARAVTVAGSDAVVALHEKSLLEPTVRAVVQHAVRANGEDLFVSLQRAVQAVPERERERRRRVARLEESRLAASHPPTGMRIALIEARPPSERRVELDSVRSAAIDAALSPLRPRCQATMIDEYRASLYYR